MKIEERIKRLDRIQILRYVLSYLLELRSLEMIDERLNYDLWLNSEETLEETFEEIEEEIKTLIYQLR